MEDGPNLLGWSNRDRIKEEYARVCELIATDSRYFQNFKRNNKYTPILEHVDYNLGKEYLDIILLEYEDELLDRVLEKLDEIKENDRLGSPVVHNYPMVGIISPTTLRYMKVLMDILSLGFDLNGMDVVEIGGGYGGQALILSKFFDFDSYTILDLETASMVQNKYLSEHEFDVNATTIDNHTDRRYDFVLSNYAFSEISKKYQDIYLNRVIRDAGGGYFQINPDADECYNHKELRNIFSNFPNPQFLPDNPMNHRYPNNFIFTFRKD